MAFCRMLPESMGVAAIPVSAFYSRPESARHLVRFAFCKTDAMLDEGLRRLAPPQGLGGVRVAGLQLDIAWEDPEANYRAHPALARGREGGRRPARGPARDVPLRLLHGPRARGRARGRTEHALPPRAGTEPRPPPRGLRPRADGGRSAAFQHPDPRRARRVARALPKDPSLHLRGRRPSTTRRGTAHVTAVVDGLRLTLFVCYDLRFADEFWATAEGTDAYLVVANWPERRRHHWTTLLHARAIENQAYVVGVNRVGEGDGLVYTGDSRIVDPWGEAVATAAGRETLLHRGPRSGRGPARPGELPGAPRPPPRLNPLRPQDPDGRIRPPCVSSRAWRI